MRAAVVDRYGPPEVVRVVDVADPRHGRDGVLVRVSTAAVTSGDARIRAARFPPGFTIPARLAFGLRRPRRTILGSTFSGVVEAVGDRVDDIVPGDQVCGMTGMKMAAHAELVAVPRARIAVIPSGVGHDDAAGLLFGGTAALYFIRDKGSVGNGATVLVNGASGAVGTNAVQIARHLGGTVTGVTSGANAALVTDLGASTIVDHTTTDLDSLDERFDVVFDTVGNVTIDAGRRLLRPGGRLLLAVAGLGETLRARGDVAAGSTPERREDFQYLLGLVAAGDLRVVLDRTFTLDQIVDAHRHVDSGRKVGNVLVRP